MNTSLGTSATSAELSQRFLAIRMKSLMLLNSAEAGFAAPQTPPKSRRMKTARVIFALMMRELSTTDSRTSLGFLWLLVEPIAAIALLTFLFSLMSRNPPIGTNFQLYYVTGIVPFQMYTEVASKVSSSVRYSRPLLGFPAVTAVDAIIARFLLNFVLISMVFVIVTVSIIKIYGLYVIVDYALAVQSLVLAGFLALGIGTFNCVLFLAFPTYENVFGVLMRPLMLVSGVLFLTSELPTQFQSYLYWNPILHVVGLMRAAFYPSFDTSQLSPIYVVMFALTTLVLGMVMLRRYLRHVMEK